MLNISPCKWDLDRSGSRPCTQFRCRSMWHVTCSSHQPRTKPSVEANRSSTALPFSVSVCRTAKKAPQYWTQALEPHLVRTSRVVLVQCCWCCGAQASLVARLSDRVKGREVPVRDDIKFPDLATIVFQTNVRSPGPPAEILRRSGMHMLLALRQAQLESG